MVKLKLKYFVIERDYGVGLSRKTTDYCIAAFTKMVEAHLFVRAMEKYNSDYKGRFSYQVTTRGGRG